MIGSIHRSSRRGLRSERVAGSGDARPFELVTFVHDGQVVHDRATGRLDEQKYIELLGRRYETALR